jgi:predicted nucleic acid-binding Zn ribbon protein
MQISAVFIGFLLFVAAMAYVGLPFRQRQTNASPLHAATSQEGKRETVIAALRDLDFDFRIGKVSEEDYQPLRAQLIAEAAQYLEAEEKEDKQLEEKIRTRRAVQTLKCEHCEAPIQAGQRFCSKCGSAVNAQSCPSCGKQIQAGDLFCSSCGGKIQTPVGAAAQS